jgi:hypothetical protein
VGGSIDESIYIGLGGRRGERLEVVLSSQSVTEVGKSGVNGCGTLLLQHMEDKLNS